MYKEFCIRSTVSVRDYFTFYRLLVFKRHLRISENRLPEQQFPMVCPSIIWRMYTLDDGGRWFSRNVGNHKLDRGHIPKDSY